MVYSFNRTYSKNYQKKIKNDGNSSNITFIRTVKVTLVEEKKAEKWDTRLTKVILCKPIVDLWDCKVPVSHLQPKLSFCWLFSKEHTRTVNWLQQYLNHISSVFTALRFLRPPVKTASSRGQFIHWCIKC